MNNFYKNTIYDLTGQIGIVTGGASGLGRAMALALSKAGADIIIADINEKSGINVRDEIKNLGRRSLFIKTDISKKTEVKEMVAETVSKFGKLDIAVNSVRTSSKYMDMLSKSESTKQLESQYISEEEIRRQIDVMLIGVLFCCQEQGKQMIKQKYGHIINIASISASIVCKGLPGTTVYCMIKAGIKHMSKALAADWVKYNITVNSISPGNMKTPPGRKLLANPEYYKKVVDICPMNRLGMPEELDGAVIYLASKASNFVTGHDLIVDGGVTIW